MLKNKLMFVVFLVLLNPNLYCQCLVPAKVKKCCTEIEKCLQVRDWTAVDTIVEKTPLDKFPNDNGFFSPEVAKKNFKRKLTLEIDFLKRSSECASGYDDADASVESKHECYKNLLNFYNHEVPKDLPYSKEFISELNFLAHMSADRLEILANRISDREREIRDQKNAIAEKERKEESLKDEAQRLKNAEDDKIRSEAENLYDTGMSKAAEDFKYKKMDFECSVCASISSKFAWEAAIKEEKAYSLKYGAINLGKIDGYKQNIITADHSIKQKSDEYQKLTGRQFKKEICKSLPKYCPLALQELQATTFLTNLTAEQKIKDYIVDNKICNDSPDITMCKKGNLK